MFVFVKYTQKHNHRTGSLKAFPKLSFTNKIHHRRHFSSLFFLGNNFFCQNIGSRKTPRWWRYSIKTRGFPVMPRSIQYLKIRVKNRNPKKLNKINLHLTQRASSSPPRKTVITHFLRNSRQGCLLIT